MRTSVPERLSLVSNGFYMNKWLRKQLKQPCVKWKINTRKMNVFLVAYLGASEVLKLCFILWKENILSKLQKGSLEEISSISVQLKKNYVVVTSMPGFDTGRSYMVPSCYRVCLSFLIKCTAGVQSPEVTIYREIFLIITPSDPKS